MDVFAEISGKLKWNDNFHVPWIQTLLVFFLVFCNCTIILKFRHIVANPFCLDLWSRWFMVDFRERWKMVEIYYPFEGEIDSLSSGGASFLVSPNWSDKNVHFITSSSPWSGFLLIFWAQNQQVQGGQTTVDASSLHHWTWRQAGPALFQSLGYLAFEVGDCGAQLPNFPWVFLQLWWIHEQKWESNH